MKPKRKITATKLRYSIMLFFKALILVFSVVSFLVALFNHYSESAFPRRGNIVLALLYFVILFWTMMTYNCFKIGKLRLKELTFSLFISIVITNFITYLILSLLAEAMVRVVPLLVLCALQLSFGITVYIIANAVYPNLFKPRTAVFISGSGEYDSQILRKMKACPRRFDICRTLDEQIGYDAIVAAAAEYPTIILGNLNPELKAALTTFCFVKRKEFYLLPGVNDIVLQSAQNIHLGDSMLLFCRNQALSFEQRFLKRTLDIFVSVIGIIISSPFMLLTALAVKLYDRGPVLFRQKRYTCGEKVFTLVKFRSMVVDAEKDGARFTVDKDPRITPIGRVIRALRLDELPQLFNILAGDMSLVGPRAERLENTDAYTEQMPEFRYRLKVKAGLTGYAQVYGKYNTGYEDKARMDIYYITNYSLLLDLKLILYTIKIMFIKDSTDGFESASLSESLPPQGGDTAARESGLPGKKVPREQAVK